MPVEVINNNRGGGLLGTLGTIASLGGMFIPGAQFLTPLGMGMSAADGLMNGNVSADNLQRLGGLKDGVSGLGDLLSGGINSGNIAKSEPDISELLSRGWGRYNYF